MAEKFGEEDARAIGRCLKGDREAFGVLVKRYRALSVAVAYSICRDRTLAEDVAQDAFVRAFERLGQLSRHESFCAWLLNIVRNVALRAAQNVVRREEVYGSATADRGPHEENPTAAMEFAELVGRLAEDEQETLMLKYVHGMTSGEIARWMGLPVGTVTSKVSRALARLRQAVRREKSREDRR